MTNPNPDRRRLDSKIFIVTGGTQGLGETIARRLAALGASGLVICGRNQDRGAAVAQELSDARVRTVFVSADLAVVDDCRRVVGACEEAFGRLDGLVNAAATSARGSLENSTPELYDRIMATNVRGPFFLMQDAVALMKREGNPGSIVNVLSMSSHGGQPNLTPYSVSKGALATLTKNAANALRSDRIRVNGLNIGWMATPGEHAVQLSEGQPEDWLTRADAAQPFGRILRPEDVAGMTAYLLSDESEMMTGALVDFDHYVMGVYNP